MPVFIAWIPVEFECGGGWKIIDTEENLDYTLIAKFMAGTKAAYIFSNSQVNIFRDSGNIDYSVKELVKNGESKELELFANKNQLKWKHLNMAKSKQCNQCAGTAYYSDPYRIDRLTCSKCHGRGKPGLKTKIVATGTY